MLLDWLLAGIETEYGLAVEGRGAESQIDDSMALVRGYPGECFVGWDYRFESPRADLRGFRLDRLEVDPEDAKFDEGRSWTADHDLRSDRILPNGARFYNDHGHPEYATPECHSLDELMLHDLAGEQAVLSAARAYEVATGLRVRVYKNNTDFHGASYGTHESYLAPRSLGFEGLYKAVMPMLVARTLLCGAGKVGAESGGPKRSLIKKWLGTESPDEVTFQLSQRADFFVEPFNAETLFRRPIFNTRDEPHADPRKWIRVHVISGDANRLPSCTRRKVGLVQLAIALEAAGAAPVWEISDPVAAFRSVARPSRRPPPSQSDVLKEAASPDFADLLPDDMESRLEGRATASGILESYFAAGEKALGLNPGSEGIAGELYALIRECRELLEDLTECQDRFRRHVDWAAKQHLLSQYVEAEGVEWSDPVLQALDLEYSNLHPEESLYQALVEADEVVAGCLVPASPEQILRPSAEPRRAFARGLAVQKFREHLVTATWASMTFEFDDQRVEVHLDPTKTYGSELAEIDNVRQFVARLQEIADDDHPS